MRWKTAAALLTAAGGAAGWEIQRRRDRRARDDDPDWQELNRPLRGRTHEVTSPDGTSLHVEVFGPESATTIVLIHGWVEALRLWHHQIRDLAETFRVVAYDQRGHGASGEPGSGGYTDAALSDDLNAVLDACVPTGTPSVLAGHSMGGMTIVAWAGRNPDAVRRRVIGAALINTGMSELVTRTEVLGGRAGQRVHEALMPALFATPLALPTRFDPISYRIVRRIAFDPSAGIGAVAFGHEMFVSADPPVRAGFGHMFIPLDLSASVRSLDVPAVVIAGEHDRLLPQWHSEQLAAALPDLLEYAVLPDVAHMAMLEAPAEVTDRLRMLAERVRKGARASRAARGKKDRVVVPPLVSMDQIS